MKSIKEAAEELRISKSTLRYYDQISLVKPSREQNGYRMYSEEEITRIKYIIVMKYGDFKIDEIQTMMHSMEIEPSEDCIERTEALLAEKQKEFQYKIAFYQEMLSLLEAVPNLSDIDDQKELEINNYIDRVFQKLAQKDAIK
ncbi:MerR family transcriptional regulator [Enterococcus larvae]|uniref:MerR family transcriptional regulator n=1 Tax=Enterococcus larvae TaxID=2794352 RepID=UPI003F2C0FBE